MKQIILFTICIVATSCQPMKESDEFSFQPLEYNNKPTSDGVSAFVLAGVPPDCAKKPTQSQVLLGEWVFFETMFTRSQALKLGIPIVSASASHEFRVFVRDFKRFTTCNSADNTTKLNYGHNVRVVIEIESYKAEIGTSLSSIAANGSLNSNSQKIFIYTKGVNNPDLIKAMAKISGKPFDVPNYHLFETIMADLLIVVADPKTKFGVELIGIDLPPSIEDETLTSAPMYAYALSQIAKGNNCLKCKSKFGTNQNASSIVENTYKSFGLKCDDTQPNEAIQAKANSFLQGVKIKN